MIRRIAVAVGLFGFLLTAGVLLTHRSHNSLPVSSAMEWSPDPSVSLALRAAQAVNATAAAHTTRSARPVYRYSIVPGGVRSGAELRQAAANDPSVAAHYAGFRYGQARLARLKQAKLVYLSYRMNGRILWTKARHRLPAGETVLTDGETMARTRCANQISVLKRLPVAEAEPTIAQLEELIPRVLPPARVDLPAQYQSALLSSPNAPGAGPLSAPPLLGGIPWFPPPLPVGGGGTTGGTPPPLPPPPLPPPPTPVPEPGSFVLISSGLAAVVAAWRKKRAAR